MSAKAKTLEVVEDVPIYRDPLNPVLVNSPALLVTPEQDLYIKEILDICCSDSRFAQKAYVAIIKTLTGEELPPTELTGISPTTAVAGDATITLTADGTGFTSDSAIKFNGVLFPTALVSDLQLTTQVDASFLVTPDTYPVSVDTLGVETSSFDFVVSSPVLRSAPTDKTDKELGHELKKQEKELEVPQHKFIPPVVEHKGQEKK